jgi:2-methylisocitrate lyase-like PEP mutase family enzyme
VERARRFEEAGADILFVEAVTTLDEIRALPQRLAAPQLMNMVIGGKTPITSAEELATLGYGLVLYANEALTVLRDNQCIDEDAALVAPFAERQRLVRKADWDALEAKYANGRP